MGLPELGALDVSIAQYDHVPSIQSIRLGVHRTIHQGLEGPSELATSTEILPKTSGCIISRSDVWSMKWLAKAQFTEDHQESHDRKEDLGGNRSPVRTTALKRNQFVLCSVLRDLTSFPCYRSR